MSTMILIISLFLQIILFYIIQCKLRRVGKLTGDGPGPPSYPLIGCLISFYKNRNRLLDWYTELLEESANKTIVIHRFGARRTVVTANPDNVEYMLKTNFNNFPKGKPFTEILGDFLGFGIFNVDGELWQTQRKLASHEFSTMCLKEYYINTLEEEIQTKLLPILESLAASNEVVDLQQLLRRFAFNVICMLFLGMDRCRLDPCVENTPLSKAFDVASEISAKRGTASLFIIWKIKRWLGIGSERRLKAAVEEVHHYVMDMIQSRKKNIEDGKAEGEDLLTRLINAGNEDEVIRDMVISFIMAGRDTTSAAMTWFFWLLSCNQNVEQQVVNEINQHTTQSSKTLDYESIKEMRMLKACLCESMRLYPPIAWDSKHAIGNDLLPDKTRVQAGDRVTYFPYGMGRMKALWGKDRLEFNPDRWFLDPVKERGALKNICPFRFPIFQAGPRVCIGKEMAFIQMKYVVASVLRQFKITPINSKKPVYVPLLTAHMAGGLKVLISKRDRDNAI